MRLSLPELKEFLDEKHDQFNNPAFIETDPISIPHQFSKKEDIEIAGFFSATISWGQRPIILRNASKLMEMTDNSPHDFIINHLPHDLKPFEKFVHRTFNGVDCKYFIRALNNIYKYHKGLEYVISNAINKNDETIKNGLTQLKAVFFDLDNHSVRTMKHVSSPHKNSSCKRLNMYLRWMVRNDKRGVDFGIWENINQAQLCCPLDIHTGKIARKLGILKRNQDDWKAVMELTNCLKKLNPYDPIKYDFALYGLGVFEQF
ncbi:MAG: TIGR02757 family protein [Bacteroidia bacterium]|nr:TIGR02757 family protein [Bacteroidia bacterium]